MARERQQSILDDAAHLVRLVSASLSFIRYTMDHVTIATDFHSHPTVPELATAKDQC